MHARSVRVLASNLEAGKRLQSKDNSQVIFRADFYNVGVISLLFITCTIYFQCACYDANVITAPYALESRSREPNIKRCEQSWVYRTLSKYKVFCSTSTLVDGSRTIKVVRSELLRQAIDPFKRFITW